MMGLRPVVEIMMINFSLLAIDQIVSNASKLRSVSGGQVCDPHPRRRRPAAVRHPLPEPGGLVRPCAWAESGRPGHPGRGQGPARRGDPHDDPVIVLENLAQSNTRGEVPDG
jgi:pyruvate dehydrogenase E1 component beta subunit